MLEASGGWAWGYGLHDRYVGYVWADALGAPVEPTHLVEARAALLFAEPSSRAAVRAVLPIGARLAGQAEGDFLETADGFVPRQQLRPIECLTDDPVEVAEQLIGTPYLWGGRGIGGIDCSGLVQLAFGLAGVSVPRDSDQQAAAGRAAAANARRGDLLFFPDHVALLAGPDTVVHASGHWMEVRIESLADLVARLGTPIARRRVLP